MITYRYNILLLFIYKGLQSTCGTKVVQKNKIIFRYFLNDKVATILVVF